MGCVMRSNLWKTSGPTVGLAAVVAALALGCTVGNPSAGSASYKQGELGNGAFLFKCDDTVACDFWSGAAKTFPEYVATGSNFQLRFVARSDQGTVVDVNGPD